MPVLIRAVIDRATGIVSLRFPFDRDTIATIKSVPGSRWDPDMKQWRTSEHGLAALERAGLKIDVTMFTETRAVIPDMIASKLRPYQLEGADFLIRRAGALLTMDMRTGKTPTAIAALSALLMNGRADSALVLYPAGVREGWQAELARWAQLEMEPLEGNSVVDDAEIIRLNAKPWLIIGCHYEILDKHELDLHSIFRGRRFAIVADELHQAKNRKSGRYRVASGLAGAIGKDTEIGAKDDRSSIESGICVARWGLTGTPMRNRPRDLWALFDLVLPGSMGGYWTYGKRYCDSAIDDRGHWTDHGESNSDELAARLDVISFRKTRADVAQYLPKSERRVIACSMPPALAKKYKALESHLATSVGAGLADADPSGATRDALKHLASATAAGKIPTAYDRIRFHLDRGSKVIVFANFHETLKSMDERLDGEAAARAEDDPAAPHFCAGGWMTPDKRAKMIDTWRAVPGPAALLLNTVASGVGIDLSDAEVAIFLELAWVPSDFVQAEARIQDVHLGKRRSPPLYEYLIVKGTIDEAMAAALLAKIRMIEGVVGRDAESGGVAATLRGAEVIGSSRLGLPNNDHETVMAALASVRARLLGEPVADALTDTAQAIAADMAEAWDDEEPEQAEAGG